jgi:hypothetical protein
VPAGTPNPRSICARKTRVSPVPSVGNSSPAAGLQPTCDLGLSSPRSASNWICSSVTVDASQTVHGSGTGAFSILPSSKPVHLDLKVMGDLVRMRGRGDSGPKLGGAATFSGHCAAAQALSGNGGKWRPLGRRSALYNRGPAAQRMVTPRGLFGANHGEPTVWHPQRIYCPTALSGLTAIWR